MTSLDVTTHTGISSNKHHQQTSPQGKNNNQPTRDPTKTPMHLQPLMIPASALHVLSTLRPACSTAGVVEGYPVWHTPGDRVGPEYRASPLGANSF